MKICMILHDPQEFGGLEEYATTLAISLKQCGQQVSVLSTTWVAPDNQYVCRLLEHGVTYVQVPKWLSHPASHWPTKEKILGAALWLASPLILLMSLGVLLVKQVNWRQAWTSAHGWLQGHLQPCFLPNRYQPLTSLLLTWWSSRWRPDLLHIQGYTSTLLFVIEWAFKRNIPVVYEEHQTPDPQFDWWRGFQQSINKATRVVAVSEKSAEGLREVCGVTRPIVVLSPLVPDPIALEWSKDEQLSQANGTVQITTIARLAIPKGLTYLLETIVKVKEVYPFAQFKVFGDGPQRSELMAYASKLGLDGNDIFAGPFTSRQELSEIMAHTDIFVMSSILEGQPLSVVEAMAYGCPIVTTSVGGIPELIRDGDNGLLCPPKDPDCLAEKIMTLIKDPDFRSKLGKAARKSYEQGPFQPVSVCNEFITLYGRILQGQLA